MQKKIQAILESQSIRTVPDLFTFGAVTASDTKNSGRAFCSFTQPELYISVFPSHIRGQERQQRVDAAGDPE